MKELYNLNFIFSTNENISNITFAVGKFTLFCNQISQKYKINIEPTTIDYKKKTNDEIQVAVLGISIECESKDYFILKKLFVEQLKLLENQYHLSKTLVS
ncbi:MAG: hypothetical protein ACI4L1_01370 [Christensenellales bacterium]